MIDRAEIAKHLTLAGRPEHSEAIRRYFFNPLSSDEIETLATVFDRLLDNLAEEKAVTGR